MNTVHQERPAKISAAVITLFVHAILFFILMMVLLTRPDPPLSGGEGMVVNLGYVDESTGEIQPMSENTMTDVTHPEMPQPQQSEETTPLLTQEDEETEKIEVKEDKKIKIKVDQSEPEKVPVEEIKEVKKEKTADPKSLYKGKTNNSSSQGTSTQGTGDQGDPKGDPNSKYYGKSGDGNSQGTGGGPGGSGPGGISFDLKDRRPQRLPEPEYNVQEEGKVVVEITVDRNGNVIHAKAGIKGSTTTNTYLLDKARLAALTARFDANQNAPEFQKGYISYNFLLK